MVKREKPCARGGCSGTVAAIGPKAFEKAKYCRVECKLIEWSRLGRYPNCTSPEKLAASGRAGGIARGRTMKRRRTVEAVTLFESFIPARLLDSLNRLQRAAIQVASNKAVRIYYERGYQAAIKTKSYRAKQTQEPRLCESPVP